MRFALVDGERCRPEPGLRGRCCRCGHEMIAKCGDYVRWHWAHKSRERCDPWWENETAWHLAWKDEFPDEWQEVVHTDDSTGERHIADVRTDTGLVIEFQHSRLSETERRSREAFYGNLIWVVDGDRGTLDPIHFYSGRSDKPATIAPVVFGFRLWAGSRLFDRWQSATAPVFFDFGTSIPLGGDLWHIRDYRPHDRAGVAYWIPRHAFLDHCFKGGPIRPVRIDPRDAHHLEKRLVRMDRIRRSTGQP